jgi:hypothetical protein
VGIFDGNLLFIFLSWGSTKYKEQVFNLAVATLFIFIWLFFAFLTG